MLQNTSKTLGFQKIMVYKTPPGGGEVNHIWLVAYVFYIFMKTISIFIKESILSENFLSASLENVKPSQNGVYILLKGRICSSQNKAIILALTANLLHSN